MMKEKAVGYAASYKDVVEVVWGGMNMSMSERQAGQGHNEAFSLLCISVAEVSASNVRRVARRICRNVRRSDCVLYVGRVCAVVFPGTPLGGAQTASQRLRELLVDVEFELQVLGGVAALTMLQHLRAHSAIVVQREEEVNIPARPEESERRDEAREWDRETLPHLAVLPQYPAPRILHLFPYELAARYHCVPVGAERTMLTLATSRHLDTEVIAHFQELTRRNIFLVHCEARMIDDILLYWQRIAPIRPFAVGV